MTESELALIESAAAAIRARGADAAELYIAEQLESMVAVERAIEKLRKARLAI